MSFPSVPSLIGGLSGMPKTFGSLSSQGIPFEAKPVHKIVLHSKFIHHKKLGKSYSFMVQKPIKSKSEDT